MKRTKKQLLEEMDTMQGLQLEALTNQRKTIKALESKRDFWQDEFKRVLSENSKMTKEYNEQVMILRDTIVVQSVVIATGQRVKIEGSTKRTNSKK